MKLAWSVACVCWLGCVTPTVTQRVVDRSLMEPLRDPPMALLVPSEKVALHLSASMLSTFGAPPPGADPNGGVQLPLAQLALGALVRFDSGVVFGGELHAAPGSLAVKTASGQFAMSNDFMAGVRARVGYAWVGPSGLGFTVSVEPGFDLLPQNDSLTGGQSDLHLSLSASVGPTYSTGPVRLYLGAAADNAPRMSRQITVTCNSFSGCGTTAYDDQDMFSAGAVAGARYQLRPDLAAAVSLSLMHESAGWVPALGLSFALDLARPRAQPEPAEPAPELRLETPAVPPPPLFTPPPL